MWLCNSGLFMSKGDVPCLVYWGLHWLPVGQVQPWPGPPQLYAVVRSLRFGLLLPVKMTQNHGVDESSGLDEFCPISKCLSITYYKMITRQWHRISPFFFTVIQETEHMQTLTFCSSASATALSWLSLSVCCPILAMRASMSVFFCHSSTSCTASLAFRSSTWVVGTGRVCNNIVYRQKSV